MSYVITPEKTLQEWQVVADSLSADSLRCKEFLIAQKTSAVAQDKRIFQKEIEALVARINNAEQLHYLVSLGITRARYDAGVVLNEMLLNTYKKMKEVQQTRNDILLFNRVIKLDAKDPELQGLSDDILALERELKNADSKILTKIICPSALADTFKEFGVECQPYEV